MIYEIGSIYKSSRDTSVTALTCKRSFDRVVRSFQDLVRKQYERD